MSHVPRFESENVDPSPLGRPLTFTFSGRTAPNRFLAGAMSERLASFTLADIENRGIPSPELVNVYKNRGTGGIGLNLTGNVMIDPGHLEAAGNTVIPRRSPFSGERFERFRELAAAGKAAGGLIVAQVGHPGRQTPEYLQSNTISASAVPMKTGNLGMTFATPRAATEDDIAGVIDGFAHAAEFLDKAGFDGLELHGAHGYLLSQFLSPTTNLRNDRHGGSLENRMRLIVEVRDEIAKRVRPDFVVGIKINSVEFQEKGFQPEEAKELCRTLENHKFDFVELSGGTYENWPLSDPKRSSTIGREAFFLQFAKLIVPGLTKTKTYVTGGMKTVEGMVKALDTVDGVGLGRPLCQEPSFCKDILSGKIQGSMVQKIDMQNFFATAAASGLQIKQLGQELQPIDLSIEENTAKTFGALGQWKEAQQKNPDLYQFPAVPDYNVPFVATMA
ncbi:hypothetical protein N7466_003955 [Penicillium verhagenii]|uniref:uncharacterized protein n=1 Tax=Penicillium verhagenii TaxID=1562060 RepID=UPI0025458D78|nr:uncharacterized protein N7466_003955 [Penicillium verhagenii]KAJ5934408.1 hypothetical protein N7466_003955 [Penicillium verhagenii]